MNQPKTFSAEWTMPDGSKKRIHVPGAVLFYATIAGERTLMAVHQDQESPDMLAVSHVSTGKRVAVITQIERLLALGSWPEAARSALARVVRKHGAGHVAYKLVSADLDIAEKQAELEARRPTRKHGLFR